MITQKTTLLDISQEKSLRYDVDYIKFHQTHTDSYLTFNDLFTIAPGESCSEEELNAPFSYCEIGNSDKNGDITPVILNFEDRTLEDENYYKKIENGDITPVDLDDILISKVRPNLKKYIRITNDKKDVYFTTAFIRLKAKEMPDVLYYCLRSVFYENLMAIARQGKGYPTINEKDLLTLRFNETIINKLRANYTAISTVIADVESRIAQKTSSLVPTKKTIDSVFQREFGLDISDYQNIDHETKVHISQKTLVENNRNLRFSYRWNKAAEFQSHTAKHVGCASLLGQHIVSTQNGWSPTCDENESGYQVLGIDAISTDGILSFNNPKFSSSYKKDFSTYCISDGDFFVSRGNTVALVAMASVAHFNADEMPDTVYPDLMIKVEFDEVVDKQYMAYVFNSFIGRYYFKYSTKGKNQTMVKVSPRELNHFIVPLPDVSIQQRIVGEIQAEIKKQDDIKAEIESLRNQIDDIIIKTISA